MTRRPARLRYNLGLAILDLVRHASQGQDPEATYRRCWRVARRISWLLSARQSFANGFRLSWEPYVAERLLSRVAGRGAIPEWAVRTDTAMIDRVARDLPSPPVVAVVHTGVSEAAIQAVRRIGGEPVVVRSKVEAGDQSVRKLPPNSNILLLIRKSMRRGETAIVPVDFRWFDPGTGTHRHFLSTVLFEAASRLGAPLLFAGSRVETDGVIRTTLSNVIFPTGAEGAAGALAEEFRQFIRQTTGTPADWTVLTSSHEVAQVRRARREAGTAQ